MVRLADAEKGELVSIETTITLDERCPECGKAITDRRAILDDGRIIHMRICDSGKHVSWAHAAGERACRDVACRFRRRRKGKP